MDFIDALIDTFINALIVLLFLVVIGSVFAIPVLAITNHSAWYLLLFIVWLVLITFCRLIIENY